MQRAVAPLLQCCTHVGSIHWDGFSNEELASIKAPLLIINGDHDFVRVEHAVETVKRIPNAELAIIPDASHFVLHSEQERVIPIVKHFLDKPDRKIGKLPHRHGGGAHLTEICESVRDF